MFRIVLLMDLANRAQSNQECPGAKPGRLILNTACRQERLFRKRAASHPLVSVDLCAESRCPAMDSSSKYPAGCSGSDVPVDLAGPAAISAAVDCFQLRYSFRSFSHIIDLGAPGEGRRI